jgi:leucyl/phenylalanyl-tRNA---protein transferase
MTSIGSRNFWQPGEWGRHSLDGSRPPPHPLLMSRTIDPFDITPQILLKAYSIGLFPMAEDADDPTLFWMDPKERGIFPLTGLIVSKSLAKTVRSDRYEIRVDHDFDAVIAGCAKAAADRPRTWINGRIRRLYRELFDAGAVHTIETYDNNRLVGGLYGVSLGAAFFGESMFHRARDASKVALVHLVARLRSGRFQLLDTQFVTPHLASLGAVSISRDRYHELLEGAVEEPATFSSVSRILGREALALVVRGAP